MKPGDVISEREPFRVRENGHMNGAPDTGEPLRDTEARELGRDQAVSPAPTARPLTPPQIVDVWAKDGPIVRVATGLPTLDDACRGGFPAAWRVMIVGAPSAAKTALGLVLAYRWATDEGLCVGILGVDEDPDPDLNVRLAQMAGFTIAQCEKREPAVLALVSAELAKLRIRFYDASHAIEDAADDVAAWGAQEKKRTALILDSLQAVHARSTADAKGPRELVEANVRAVRAMSTEHRMLIVGTSEANRGSYRDEDAAERTNDMAAGAESRAIEFGAQTMLMLRTPKGHADVVHVRVPKNRRGARSGFEFFLRLDRERHTLTECPDPTSDPNARSEAAAQARAKNRAQVEGDAATLAGILCMHPGVGERGMRAAVKVAGHKWGVDRLDAAKACLAAGFRGQRLTNRGTAARAAWHLEGASEGSES
jgi:hypothetical protein